MENLNKSNKGAEDREKGRHMKVQMIAAVQRKDRGIGYKGALLYHLPEDLKRFKRLTEESGIVVMGRGTWDSLPESVRPLQNRYNIVLTSRPFASDKVVHVVTSVAEALDRAAETGRDVVSIIGGEQVYNSFLPYADTLEITEIEGDKEADTFFPEFEDAFVQTAAEDADGCVFKTYVKKTKS